MLNISGRCNNEVGGGELAGVIVGDSELAKRRNRVSRALDWTTQSVIGEISRVEELSEEFVRRERRPSISMKF